MTEAEALKRFIPILGRISPPSERATITRNILERIDGQQTCIMGISHKQAGALAWPNDQAKATAFESALDMAVDTGDFVSLLHRVDRRHFQIEELCAWPDCPAIASDSPLVFWLGEPALVVAESTEQRRARWLEWYGTGERGAVQRVYERELLTNPKADRSFIGKEIEKAKQEKEKAKRSGFMVSQLVQVGKRQN